MIGAIAGDIIGSIYETTPIKSKDFPLFQKASVFTDDTVLTVAVARISHEHYVNFVRVISIQFVQQITGDAKIYTMFTKGQPMRRHPKSALSAAVFWQQT